MKAPPEKQDSRLMRGMFATIAPRYDFITRVFSYGMDRRWKRLAVARLPFPPYPRILDLACGTGDFAKLVLSAYPGAQVIAADLTEPMLRRANLQHPVCADAASLPFAAASFDAVFIGYGLRNFPRLAASIEEVRRVLKPGGMLVSLDFFLPSRWWLRQVYLGYLYGQGAFWGLLLHGRARVYTYIPDSLRNFLTAEKFSSLLANMEFAEIAAQKFMLGGIAVHWARKGDAPTAQPRPTV